MLCVCSVLVGGNLSNATDTHANSKKQLLHTNNKQVSCFSICES